jgi:hypothetical protein
MRKMAVLLALVFIASCAQVPKEKSYPVSYQEKMQASEHWRALAKDISTQVKLAISPEAKETTQIKDTILISDADQSTFGKAMRTFLATELQNQGMAPVMNPPSTYLLRWKVQEVYHQADRSSNSGLPVALADGLQAAFVGGADVKDKKPHSEIIISYELIKDQNIRHFAQVFYVDDVDIYNYRSKESQAGLRPITYDVTNR